MRLVQLDGSLSDPVEFVATRLGLLQTSHAPYGLLKENDRGSSACTLLPHCGQAFFWEKSLASPFTTATITSPSASFDAVAMEAPRRF